MGIVLGGCSGSTAVSSVIDPVAQAAKVSELAPGFKASVSEQLIPPGSSETVTASGGGIFDQRHGRGTMSLQIHANGHSSNAETQYSDFALYMRLPSFQESTVTHGKAWVKFDLRSVDTALGINLSALSSSGSSSNPSQLLSYLKATGSRAVRIGNEKVRGVPTTHYRAAIDYDRYAMRVAPTQRVAANQSVAALERLTGSHSQTVDVWVDGQHRVRREEMIYNECLPNTTGTTKIHLTIEYFDFGTQLIPALPPSSEVADLTSYISKKLRHIKLGCQ